MSVGGMNQDGSHAVGTSGQLRQNPVGTSECLRQLRGDFHGGCHEALKALRITKIFLLSE